MKHQRIDVLVIGAGQAGLAMGYYLRQTARSFLLVDASLRIGDSWRNRYDSLVLFSPRAYSALPGFALCGDPEGFPTKDEVADYLETYAHYFSLPVQLNVKVEKLERMDDRYRVVTTQGDFLASDVVIATGPFQKPFIPQLPGVLSTGLFQIHSSAYRNPAQLPPGTVLVIGAGNAGAQIAAELAKSHRVYLSAGHQMVLIPRRILHRSLFWWLEVSGLSKAVVGSRLAAFLQQKEPIIGMELKPLIQRGQIRITGRTAALLDQEVELIDGTKMGVDSVIWATGFEFDYHWITIPGVLNQQKRPIHHRGISPVKGLYFLGLPWLSRSGSAQLNGIGYDAKYVGEHFSREQAQ